MITVARKILCQEVLLSKKIRLNPKIKTSKAWIIKKPNVEKFVFLHNFFSDF